MIDRQDMSAQHDALTDAKQGDYTYVNLQLVAVPQRNEEVVDAVLWYNPTP
jgi:hypothetical protein